MKKVSLKRIIALQIIVIIYTFSTVFAKLAAQENTDDRGRNSAKKLFSTLCAVGISKGFL